MGLFSSRKDSSGNDTRRPDGKPETARDKKFFDLRESGFTGPVDHTGNAVLDMDEWLREQQGR